LVIATIPLTFVALPVSVPTNVPPTKEFAVITPAAKSVFPSLPTMVLG